MTGLNNILIITLLPFLQAAVSRKYKQVQLRNKLNHFNIRNFCFEIYLHNPPCVIQLVVADIADQFLAAEPIHPTVRILDEPYVESPEDSKVETVQNVTALFVGSDCNAAIFL